MQFHKEEDMIKEFEYAIEPAGHRQWFAVDQFSGKVYVYSSRHKAWRGIEDDHLIKAVKITVNLKVEYPD